jgi:hypothetical protein
MWHYRSGYLIIVACFRSPLGADDNPLGDCQIKCFFGCEIIVSAKHRILKRKRRRRFTLIAQVDVSWLRSLPGVTPGVLPVDSFELFGNVGCDTFTIGLRRHLPEDAPKGSLSYVRPGRCRVRGDASPRANARPNMGASGSALESFLPCTHDIS